MGLGTMKYGESKRDVRIPFPSRVLSCDEKREGFQASMTGSGRVDQEHEIVIVSKSDVGRWGDDVGGIS